MRSLAIAILFACGQLKYGLAQAQEIEFAGTATDVVSQAALSGVHVSLISLPPDHEKAWGAMSDKAGHFSIAKLPAGSYLLLTQKTGFVPVAPITQVQLKPGETQSDFLLSMTQEAVIRGRVLDADGDPIPDANLELEPVAGKPSVDAPDEGEGWDADDLGEFQIAAPPGRYYVLARGPRFDIRSREIGAMYYPGVAAKAHASVVEAVAGRETAGIEIRLGKETLYSISGTVAGFSAEQVGGAIVRLTSEGEFRAEAPVRANGAFRIDLLSAGVYEAVAIAGQLRSPAVEVRLENADATNLQLMLGTASPLSGTVEIAGQAGAKPGSAPKRSVTFAPLGRQRYVMFGQTARADVDGGTFRMEPPTPGRYRVTLEPMPADGYIRSTEVDGAVNPGDLVDLRRLSAIPQVKISIGTDGARIAGRVLGADGQPSAGTVVYCLAQGQEIDLSVTPADADGEGNYRLAGIRPGKYRLFAAQAADIRDTAAIEWLQQVAARTPEIEVEANGRLTNDLKTEARHANAKQ